MNRRLTSHFFWGSHSPLSALGGVVLIILASSRFAFAIVCAIALIWVFVLTALIFSLARPIMPLKGRNVILLFLSAFFCGLFALLASLINPLLILGTIFYLLLIPSWCLSSGFFEAAEESKDLIEVALRALLEAATMAGIILAVSLVREPLGMGTISLPGSVHGIIEFFGGQDADTFVPARILSVSAGGLLLLGYVIALYRFFREQNGGSVY